MDELILLSLQGAASRSQECELLRWRRGSRENERHYQQLALVWAMTQGGDDQLVSSLPPASAEVIHRAEGRRAARAFTIPAVRSGSSDWSARIVAAAALILLGFFAADFRSDTPLDLGFGADEFVTGAGETATVALRDGTVIRLAPDSRLRLTGDMREREVFLTGRAYFAVAHQAGQPFRVRSAAGEVTVLGTRFDLETDREDLRVVVVEGRVAVAARGKAAEVGAGEASQVVNGSLLPVSRVPDVDSVADWTGRFLAFQATPLAEAAREIEREYGVKIEIADPDLAGRKITTWLADRTLDDVLRIVCAVAVVECATTDGVVTIQPQE